MSACIYCDGAIDWIETAAGQRRPFDALPAPSLLHPTPSHDDGTHVLMNGIARPATTADRKLHRPIRRQHRCGAFMHSRRPG